MKSALAFAVLLCLSALSLARGEVAASVVFFTGAPVLTAENGSTRPLVRGGSIAAGELIDTADGRVQLRFPDGASMSLQPNTQFRVDRFRYAGNGGHAAAGDGVVMSLLKGGLRTVTGWLGKRDRSQYKIGTTVATIGIRGTEFGASLDGSGLLVTTYAGLVEVCSEAACVEVAPTETVWVRSLGARPELRSGPAAGGVKADGAIPETPLSREAMPLPPPTQPVQPVQPVQPTQPLYQTPNMASPPYAR